MFTELGGGVIGDGIIPFTFQSESIDFFLATGINDINQKIALDNFVFSLKVNNLWNKMLIIYPFIGGTENTHKFNLKDPRNTDAAYRIGFSGGGWTHNSLGITPNGTSSYANTFFTSSGYTSTTNASMSLYIGTNNSGATFPYDMGSSAGGGGTGAWFGMITRYFNSITYVGFGGGYEASVAGTTDSRGFNIGNRLTGATLNTELWKAGVNDTSATRIIHVTQAFTRNNINIYLSANNSISAIPGLYSDKRIQFCHFGLSLTPSEIQSFNNAVKTLQVQLNRTI
jgi:hypothetical protein